jgi:TorA maturation chaperone TorD
VETRETRAAPGELRSRIYGFLRRVFSQEVDEAFLGWCREQDRIGLWSSLGLDFTGTLQVEELAVDFCQLFITSGRTGTPHESVHAKRRRPNRESDLLWGDPASEMKDLYREAGFELDEESHQLPDALGVELEFMEKLSEREAEAGREGLADEVRRLRELQRRMLKDHLGQWLPDYARRLQSRASTDFFRSMLELTADFIDWEEKTIAGAD